MIAHVLSAISVPVGVFVLFAGLLVVGVRPPASSANPKKKGIQ